MASIPCILTTTDRPKRLPVYPMAWAYTIIDRAIASHPRAWEILLSFTALTKRQLATLLASNDPDWPRIREMSHIIDRWLVQQARHGPEGRKYLTDVEVIDALFTMLDRFNCSESLKSYLTARKDALN